MIHDARNLPLPARIRVDVCVVGSGPGGSAAATRCAEAGLNVLLLEAGGFITPGDMTQREEEMLPRLLWHGGARTDATRTVHIHQGRGVGGSSLHNLNLCKPIPRHIRAAWRNERGLKHLPPQTWDALYAEVRDLLGVRHAPRDKESRANGLLQGGCEALGWRWALLSHNRSGCLGSGFCELGCAFDAKNHALKVLMPRFRNAGGRVLTHTQAIRVLHDSDRVTGVECAVISEVGGEVLGELHVECDRVCLAASATGTPAIMLRSDLPDPSGTTGQTLRIHPAVVCAGDFDEPVYAWRGIPQTVECTEWLHLDDTGSHRVWIVPAFGHPMGFATMLPGHGAAHRALMERYAHLAVLTAMLHDDTAGIVEPKGDLDVAITYEPTRADRAELMFGLARCAELLLAAGATNVTAANSALARVSTPAQARALEQLPLTPDTMDLTAVHPMASVAMGDDPQSAAVGSDGAHHYTRGLFVADASLFCTSIGVPPQMSVYAMGLHVGGHMAR